MSRQETRAEREIEGKTCNKASQARFQTSNCCRTAASVYESSALSSELFTGPSCEFLIKGELRAPLMTERALRNVSSQ